MHKSPPSLDNLLKVISQLFLIALLVQIPLVIQYAVSELIWAHLFAHICMTGLTIHLLSQGYLKDARLLLIIAFLTYLVGATLLWQADVFIQHFLLIGCLVCGFIFRKTEIKQSICWSTAYAVTFILLDSVHSSSLEKWEAGLRQGNSITLAISCICIITYLHKFTANRWSIISSHYKNTRQVLQKTAPLTQLIEAPNIQRRQDVPYACVMFADIKGYQTLTSSLDKNTLFTLLDTFYQSFDKHTELFNILPVKTNGDEYMAASGVTAKLTTRKACSYAILEFAFASFRQFQQVIKLHGIECELRIGMSAGPVSAGLPQRALAHFDLWGSTVNHAASLEQCGRANHLCICETLYAQIAPSHKKQFRQIVVQTKTARVIAYECSLAEHGELTAKD